MLLSCHATVGDGCTSEISIRRVSRPMISADGSRVAFQSFASDLTPGDFNGLEDSYAAAVP